MSDEHPSFVHEESATQHIERQQLRRAIAKLPQDQQDVVLLCIDHDLSLSQIGHLLEMKENTAKSHLHRAKQNLTLLLHGDPHVS